MKKEAILSLIILLNSGLFAQDHKLELGLTGGPSYSMIFGSKFYSTYYEPAVNFSGGVSAQYNFSRLISLHAEALFERKGSTSERTFTDQNGNDIKTVTYNINFDYLTLPVLLRAAFGKKAKFFVNVGPYAAFLLKQMSTFKTNVALDKKYSFTEDNTPLFNTLDLGVSVGFGISLRLRDKLGLSLEARDNFGLVNTSALPVYGGGAIKHNTTVLLLGLNYFIGGKKD